MTLSYHEGGFGNTLFLINRRKCLSAREEEREHSKEAAIAAAASSYE
jgi:hypothetical protein